MFRPDRTVSEAVQSAADFTRDAPRWLWGVQTLAALGVALVFASLRGRMTVSEAGELWVLGWWTILVSSAPLWAGLYRLELGGKARRGLGVAGFQFGKPELRLILLALAFVAAAAMVWLPVVAVSALFFVLFRFLGQVPLGPLGGVQVSFLLVLALWLAAVGGFAWLCGRCAFAVPATIGKRRMVVAQAWEMAPDNVGAVLWAWLLAQAPLLLTVVMIALVDTLEVGDGFGMAGRWPVVDAGLAGLVLGLVCSFIQAPLTVGVLGYLYRARRERVRVSTLRTVRRRYQSELLAG